MGVGGKGDLMFVRLLMTAILAAGLAFAQRGGGGSGADMGGGEGGGGMSAGGMSGGGMGGGMPSGMRRQTKEELLLDKLKLSKEQKEEGMNILAAAKEKAAPVRDQLMNGRTFIL